MGQHADLRSAAKRQAFFQGGMVVCTRRRDKSRRFVGAACAPLHGDPIGVPGTVHQ